MTMAKRRILRLTDLATAFPRAFSVGKVLSVKAVRRKEPGYSVSADGKACRIEIWPGVSSCKTMYGQVATMSIYEILGRCK
jgi:hypothetical protein